MVEEFDTYAAKKEIHNPIGFLTHKIKQLTDMEGEGFMKQQTETAEQRIAKEQFRKNLHESALQMAKDQLKREGRGYPLYRADLGLDEHWNEIQTYGAREAEYHRRYIKILEAEHNKSQQENQETFQSEPLRYVSA